MVLYSIVPLFDYWKSKEYNRMEHADIGNESMTACCEISKPDTFNNLIMPPKCFIPYISQQFSTPTTFMY